MRADQGTHFPAALEKSMGCAGERQFPNFGLDCNRRISRRFRFFDSLLYRPGVQLKLLSLPLQLSQAPEKIQYTSMKKNAVALSLPHDTSL
jgi:hypothetical protein